MDHHPVRWLCCISSFAGEGPEATGSQAPQGHSAPAAEAGCKPRQPGSALWLLFSLHFLTIFGQRGKRNRSVVKRTYKNSPHSHKLRFWGQQPHSFLVGLCMALSGQDQELPEPPSLMPPVSLRVLHLAALVSPLASCLPCPAAPSSSWTAAWAPLPPPTPSRLCPVVLAPGEQPVSLPPRGSTHHISRSLQVCCLQQIKEKTHLHDLSLFLEKAGLLFDFRLDWFRHLSD